jgi:8-oxo-dGTP diphosphatase
VSGISEQSADPARPILAVSVAVFREGRVLLARRGRAPMKGRYSLPGGRVELGETLEEAALRELYEEVAVRAEIVAFNDHLEAITRDSRGVSSHFVIASFVARWREGEGNTSEEADALLWVDPARPLPEPTTPGLAPILARAARLIGATQ